MLTLALQIQTYIKAERIPAATAIASNCNSPGSKLGSKREREREREGETVQFLSWFYSLPQRKSLLITQIILLPLPSTSFVIH
jgi:hypothetical protein